MLWHRPQVGKKPVILNGHYQKALAVIEVEVSVIEMFGLYLSWKDPLHNLWKHCTPQLWILDIFIKITVDSIAVDIILGQSRF